VDIDKLELNFIFRLRVSVRVRVGVRVSISIYLIDVIKLRIGSVLANNIHRSANPQSAFYPLPSSCRLSRLFSALLYALMPFFDLIPYGRWTHIKLRCRRCLLR